MKQIMIALLFSCFAAASALAIPSPGHAGSEISGQLNISLTSGDYAIAGSVLDSSGFLGVHNIGVYGENPVMGVVGSSPGIALLGVGNSRVTGWLDVFNGVYTENLTVFSDIYSHHDIYLKGLLYSKADYGSGKVFTDTEAGVKMLWYPRKGAFRAGYATAGTWNDANIGNYSVVSGGYDNHATAKYSTVGGGGAQNMATGLGSTVSGGLGNVAEGSTSTVPGGTLNKAGGESTWAGGFNTQLAASATGTFAWGTNSGAPYEIPTDHAFLIFPYGAKGRVGVGTTSPSADIDVDGKGDQGVIEIDGQTGGMIRLRDTNDAGWTCCTALNGALTCSTC